ncbi:Ganglioside induced differentiation associated protein, partial [Quaeritorhiza haematococci]
MLKLYDYPLAYNPMKARLALVEKGLKYETVNVNLFTGQSLQPWFMKINPRATVPVLVDGDKVLCESKDIVEYIDSLGDGPLGGANRDAALFGHWFPRLCAWDGNLFFLGENNKDASKKNLFKELVDFKIKFCEARMKENPDLADAYRAKIESANAELNEGDEPAKVEANAKELTGIFDDAEKQLGVTTWIAGNEYTLADVMMTCVLSRVHNAGKTKEMLQPRPKLSAYFDTVKGRPSWRVAVEPSSKGTTLLTNFVPAILKANGFTTTMSPHSVHFSNPPDSDQDHLPNDNQHHTLTSASSTSISASAPPPSRTQRHQCETGQPCSAGAPSTLPAPLDRTPDSAENAHPLPFNGSTTEPSSSSISSPSSSNSTTHLKVECVVRSRIPTQHCGTFHLHLYTNNKDSEEHLAIVYGDDLRSESLDRQMVEGETEFERRVRGPSSRTTRTGGKMGEGKEDGFERGVRMMEPPLARIHSACFTGETLGS